MNLSILSYKWSITKSIPDNRRTGEQAASENDYNSFNKGVPAADTFISSNAPAFTSVNPAMAALRKYANDFRCAYTGLRMISFNAYKHLLELACKPHKTDKGLINQVSKYQETMDGVELEVLKFYKHKLNSNAHKTIKDVTEEQFPKSYKNLKLQYLKTINKLRKMSSDINYEKTRTRYNTILDCWEEDLNNGNYIDAVSSYKYNQILQKMKLSSKDSSIKPLINERLQELPSARDNFDAFIVKNKDSTTKQFINNIISPFLVTIDHVKSKKRGGHASSISNCILVRAKENYEKSDTPLDVSLAMHPERIKHIQEYYQHVIDKVNNGGLKEYPWYPFEIKKTLETESKNRLQLDTFKLNISAEEAYKSFTA